MYLSDHSIFVLQNDTLDKCNVGLVVGLGGGAAASAGRIVPKGKGNNYFKLG